MKQLWKIIKWASTLVVISGLVFASSLFTVLLYGKITGKLNIGAEDGSVVFALSRPKTAVTPLEAQEAPEENPKNSQPKAVRKKEARLSAPHISQRPELPRGCEITSLTMLLQYYGIQKSKMELLPEMKKDTTPIRYNKDGSIDYWGNPNNGFVGDITLQSPGFGIYHGALFPLLKKYVPTAVDLTNQPFEVLEQQISDGIPVVVWTTTGFREPKWVIWDTVLGPFRTTFYEHAVLLVGYDEQSVYVNDPLGDKDTKVDKQQFIHLWEQMGKQALSYVRELP